jgi:hypothetical protein
MVNQYKSVLFWGLNKNFYIFYHYINNLIITFATNYTIEHVNNSKIELAI